MKIELLVRGKFRATVTFDDNLIYTDDEIEEFRYLVANIYEVDGEREVSFLLDKDELAAQRKRLLINERRRFKRRHEG
jgi:hypothetical protein